MKIPSTFLFPIGKQVCHPSTRREKHLDIPTSGPLKFKSDDFLLLRLYQVGFLAPLEWIKMLYSVEEFLRTNVFKTLYLLSVKFDALKNTGHFMLKTLNQKLQKYFRS